MNPTVSIIVPVYNAQEYLRRCVDSILGQEYQDFELLLMDDGSTDGSAEICDSYAQADSRVRTVHKENTGVSDTRNQAISQARGTYLQFLDSDDWITPDATKLLVRTAEENGCDLVIADFYRVVGERVSQKTYLQFLDSDDWITPDATKLLVRTAEENGCDLVIADFYRVVGERVSQKGDIDEDGVLTREEFAAHMMENPADFYYGVLWNKLYRRSIVEEHELCMDTKISWCEDFMFNLEYIRWAKSFCALKAPIYYYLKRKGSLVSQGASFTNTVKMKLNVFACYNSFYKHVLDEEDYEKNRLQVYRFLLDAAGDGTVGFPIFPGNKKLGDERAGVSSEAIAGEGVLSEIYSYRFLLDAAGDGTVGFPIFPGNKKLGDERAGVSSEAIAGEGVLSEIYRQRKLMERYLEAAALKNDITIQEASLLLFLRQSGEILDRRELSDFAGISRRMTGILLQRLAARGLIRIEELSSDTAEEKKKKDRRIRVLLLPAAEPVLKDLSHVQQDYEMTRFAGFDEEELIQYARLSEKMKQNMQRVLQGSDGTQA